MSSKLTLNDDICDLDVIECGRKNVLLLSTVIVTSISSEHI